MFARKFLKIGNTLRTEHKLKSAMNCGRSSAGSLYVVLSSSLMFDIGQTCNLPVSHIIIFSSPAPVQVRIAIDHLKVFSLHV